MRDIMKLARTAAKMEEARDAARSLLGDRYEGVIGKVRRTLSAKNAKNPVAAAIDLIEEKKLDGMAAVFVIAGAVDLVDSARGGS